MIDVGDKVVVTDVPEGCGLEGIEVGSVGEVVKRVDETCVDILFGGGTSFIGFDCEEEYIKSKSYGHTFVFLVKKFDNEEEKDGMLEVGDKVVVTEVLHGTLKGVEVGKVGEIIAVDYSIYTKLPYLVNFGDCKWWAGRDFLVEKLEDEDTGETPSEGEIKGAEIRHSVNVVKVNEGEGLTVGDTETYIEEKSESPPEEEIKGVEVQLSSMQDFPPLEFFKTYTEAKQGTKESDNTSEEGAYNTVIKKDGLTVYTNCSVEVVGEVMRVGGVDDLVSHFDESEDGG